LSAGTTGRVEERTLRAVARVAAPVLGWSDEAIDAEVDRERRRREVIDAHWRTSRP
jgi:hypothetical protein